MGTTTFRVPGRTLWREGAWRRWVAVALAGRLPGAMAAFALLLAGRAATGTYAWGAWMASAHAVGTALAAPGQGRRLAGGGLARGVRRGLWALALGLVILVVLCALRVHRAWLVLAAVALGVLSAGVPGGVRALLSAAVSAPRREEAFALDAVLTELQWILGPLAVGTAAALGSPLLALGLMAGCAGLAAVLCAGLPEPEVPVASASRGSAVWRVPGVGRVLALCFVLGVSWAALDAGLPPRLEEVGAGAASWGVLSALLSVASAVGGLAAASVAREGYASAARRAGVLLAAWGALLVPLAFTAGLHGLAVWLTLAGLMLAPLTGTLTFLLQGALPPARQAEGFSLYSACWALGVGAGNAVAGALLGTHGAWPVLMASALVPLLAAGVLALRPAVVRGDAVAGTGGAPSK